MSRCTTTIAGGDKPPQAAHLVPHINQMKLFLTAMGPLLMSVTALEVTMRFESSRTVTHQSNTAAGHSHETVVQPLEGASGGVSLAACESIVSLITAACPNVLRFGASGNLGGFVLRKFASSWPKLTKLEIMEEVLPARVLTGLFKLLPHLTLFKMKGAVTEASDLACSHMLSSCASLTHLFVGWGILGVEGVVLPAGLREVCCTDIPAMIPIGLQLPTLARLHLTDTVTGILEIQLLASLLRAAPRLRKLSSSQYRVNSIYVGPCTAGELDWL